MLLSFIDFDFFLFFFFRYRKKSDFANLRKKNDIFFDISKQFLRQKKNKKIYIVCGNLKNQRDFLHYEDTVKALYILARKGKSGEDYNISTGKLNT